MMGWKVMVLTLGALCCLGLARVRTGEPGHGFLNLIHRDPDGHDARYVLFVPHGYSGDSPYPLILFLHGLGESGTDGRKQVTVGLGPAVRRHEQDFPFFVIFPQSQKRSWQAGSRDATRALDILAEIEKKYRIDPKRLYLTGLSMGGFGTWSLAEKHPDRWAAIAPVCGGGNPRQAGRIKDIPCWCFHGDADPAVNVKRSRDMITALKAAGGRPTYFEYPGVGHNCWDDAYGTASLYQWLLKQYLR